MKTMVVYTSRYGSTEMYARWIAEELGCRAAKLAEVKAEDIAACDVVIYGGGLYASGIAGFKKFLAKLDGKPGLQKYVLFMVGLTNPAQKDVYENVARHNIPPELQARFTSFPLRGNQKFSQMGVLHKTMMRMLKKQAEKKPQEERTEEDRLFLETVGKDIIFADKETIAPLVQYVKGLER